MATTSGRSERRRKFRRVSGFEELAAGSPASEQATPESTSSEPSANEPAGGREGDSPIFPAGKSGQSPSDSAGKSGQSPSGSGQSPSGLSAASKWRWLLLGAVGLGILLVWLLPVIVAHSPVLPWVVAAATGGLRGEVTVESASLGWFSPPGLTGVEVRDPEGRPVLKLPRAAGDRSLWRVVRDWPQLGRFRLERPTLNLVLRPDGSNVEDLLADLLGGPEQGGPSVGLQLEIVDGTVAIQHAGNQRTWQIRQLALALDVAPGQSEPLALETSGIVADGRLPGRFAVGLKMQAGSPSGRTSPAPEGADTSPPSTPGGGEATVRAENLPLEMVAPLVERFAPGVQAVGWFSTNVQCRFLAQTALESLSIQGTAGARDLRVAAPSLGTDRVRLARVDAGCQLAYERGRLHIDRLTVQSDVGGASLSGTLGLGEDAPRDLRAWLPRQAFSVQGQVDLARLASLLPDTLRIRDETQIVSGQLQVALAGRPEPGRTEWTGRIEASDLTAVAGGRRLEWRQPILVTLAAHQAAEGPVVENLRCESDFLKVDASGSPKNMTARAAFDLGRLAAELSQLVDLGGLGLAGDGSAQLTWKRAADQQFQAAGELSLKNFQFTAGDRRPWVEPSLVATFSATGQTDLGSDTRLETAALEIAAGAEPPDRIEVQLTQPVLDLRRGGVWPLQIRSQGQFARWLPRIAPWVELNDFELAGAYQFAAHVTASADSVAGTLEATVDDLVVTHRAGNRFRRKQVRLTGRGSYDTQTRLLVIEEAGLRSGPVAATAAGRVAAAGGQPQLEIDARIDYDLEPLSELARSYLGEGLYLAGRGTCPVTFRGPLTLHGARAGASISWSWGDVYGFPLGPGELRAALADGVLAVEPTTIEVSEGQLHLAPQLRLDPQPAELYVPRGPVADNVRITPGMCAHGLQYIAPVLAGVATAEGRFSIALEGCRVPLADPAAAEVAGRMTIHSARIGPGPLVREMAVALGYTSPAQLARESTIDFRMVQGKVYHRGVRMEFPDLVISTYGWVGLDKTLGLMAEMPVPPKWLGANRLVDTALRNQTIRLPIGGTLQRPKVDQQVLRQVSRQFVEKAATNVIEDEITRGLQRLFAPPE